MNWKRFRSEFARDGVRMLRKIQQKYVLGDKRFEHETNLNLGILAQERHLEYLSLKELAAKENIPYLVVDDLNGPKSVNLLEQMKPT
jgi:hypothetical protein